MNQSAYSRIEKAEELASSQFYLAAWKENIKARLYFLVDVIFELFLTIFRTVGVVLGALVSCYTWDQSQDLWNRSSLGLASSTDNFLKSSLGVFAPCTAYKCKDTSIWEKFSEIKQSLSESRWIVSLKLFPFSIFFKPRK